MSSFARPLRLGDEAPNFQAQTTMGPMDFHEWLGGTWAILCSHPKAFTPVCTTELGELACLKSEFDKRGVKVCAVSCDNVADDVAWSDDIKDVSGTAVNYPIIADENRSVATTYGMLMIDEGTAMPATVRSVFIIGADKKIKLTITYPPSTGRNFVEILRCIDSLQLTANEALATPVNWTVGQKCVILPSVSNDAAAAKYGSFETVKPYLRTIETSQIPEKK
jgi:alkyl hydroperoxide reductase subunit AhpC